MPLIVDSYDVPAALISHKLFRRSEVVEIETVDGPTIEDAIMSEGLYCVHRERDIDGLEALKYYFNEIVEVGTSVMYINKSKKVVRYYTIHRNGDGLAEDLRELREVEDSRECVDKTAFLPHIRAQEEEIVIFPEDEED
jgi:hypothetical protein